jgi:predicted RNA-binding protein with PIN domain
MHNAFVQRLLVDGMNVIGSRPDGWWRDRDAAVRRLLARLQSLATIEDVEVTLVLDGWAPAGGPDEGQHGEVCVLIAREAAYATADDYIVDLLRRGTMERPVEVVTSDRALQARVRRLGADVGSPRALLARLDAIDAE